MRPDVVAAEARPRARAHRNAVEVSSCRPWRPSGPYFAGGESCSMMRSMVNVAAFCRGGNSLNVARNLAT